MNYLYYKTAADERPLGVDYNYSEDSSCLAVRCTKVLSCWPLIGYGKNQSSEQVEDSLCLEVVCMNPLHWEDSLDWETVYCTANWKAVENLFVVVAGKTLATGLTAVGGIVVAAVVVQAHCSASAGDNNRLCLGEGSHLAVGDLEGAFVEA